MVMVGSASHALNPHSLRFSGTHVAGIAASKSFGVAKKSNIVAVKVGTSTVVLLAHCSLPILCRL